MPEENDINRKYTNMNMATKWSRDR